MRIDAVIFDMDGLMLDTEPLYKIAWQRAAEECGHPIAEDVWGRFIGLTRIAGEQVLADMIGAGFSLERFRAACARCEPAVFGDRLPSIKPGLEDLLAFLGECGLPKAVATSTERRIAEKQLSGLGLLSGFSVLATGDEVANGKPAPDLFLLAAKRLGVEASKCLVLEDSEAGVMAAHRAGMRVFCVPDIREPGAEVLALAEGRFESLSGVEAELRRQMRLKIEI